MKDYYKVQHYCEHFGSAYTVTVNQLWGMIEIERLVELKWWQRLFRTDGQRRVWKKVYIGYPEPLRAALADYDLAAKLYHSQTKPTNHVQN